MIPNIPISPQPARCELFNELATKVWNYIIRSHAVNVLAPEIGITNYLITEIRHHALSNPNFDVYARNFKDEVTYGGDIDVFVETEKDWFIWYALQAKVLYPSGDYGKWVDKKGENQWNKLESLCKMLPQVKAYFLLFNGLDNFNHIGRLNGQIYFQDQFGCSMIENTEIAKFMSARATYYKPKFLDFHPNKAIPWRILTCFNQTMSKEQLFARHEIKDAVRSYTNLAESHAKVIETELELSSKSDNRILNANNEVGRTPDFVIHTTNSN